MSRPKVLITRKIGVPSADEALESQADVIVPATPSSDDVLAVIGEAEGLLAVRPTLITREIMEAAPKLRVISALGAGHDHVDVEAASDLGIAVASGAGIAANAVAEFAIGCMILGHRQFVKMHNDLVAGRPWAEIKRTLGPGLEGTTIGVVGYGRIGRLVAERSVAGLRADVLVYDPFVDPATTQAPAGIEFTSSLLELMERSLTVTIHVPLSDETRGLVGEKELAALGADGLLVQASRGGVVDEAAMLGALQDGVIKGAVIDVFEQEPPAPELIAALAETGRVVLTPHMASFTTQAVNDLAHAGVRDVLAVLAGEMPDSIVNRAQLKGARS